ncbi:hypothetical protein ACFXPJ_09740, partial [Streptomyces goshikiensis]
RASHPAEGGHLGWATGAPGSPEEKELKRREEEKQKAAGTPKPGEAGDLTAYTPEQLAELQRRVSEEVVRRLKGS